MSKVSASINEENYLTEIKADNKTIIADEPLDLGGGNKGFDPSQLLAGALASCTAITLRMYTERKGWKVGKITVDIELDATDKTAAKFIRKISIENPLEEAHQNRLIAIANACPVHKILIGNITTETILV